MDMLERLFPKIPLGEIVVSFVDFLKQVLSGLFNVITNSIEFLTKGFIQLMEIPPALIMIVVIALLAWWIANRSEEHTSELQSRGHLVCRLLLETKTSEQQIT